MKVAIASDSHGATDRLGVLLENLQKAGITHILHAGDFAVYGVEEIFKKYPEMKFFIAVGNCDVNEELLEEISKIPNVTLGEVVQAEIGGVKFGISHYEGIAENFLAKERVDVFCHGHTHRAKVEKRDGKLILNPGALTEDGRVFILSLPDLKLTPKFFTDSLEEV